eukprot:5283429-Prymnesium_polylepis.1
MKGARGEKGRARARAARDGERARRERESARGERGRARAAGGERGRGCEYLVNSTHGLRPPLTWLSASRANVLSQKLL